MRKKNKRYKLKMLKFKKNNNKLIRNLQIIVRENKKNKKVKKIQIKNKVKEVILTLNKKMKKQ